MNRRSNRRTLEVWKGGDKVAVVHDVITVSAGSAFLVVRSKGNKYTFFSQQYMDVASLSNSED